MGVSHHVLPCLCAAVALIGFIAAYSHTGSTALDVPGVKREHIETRGASHLNSRSNSLLVCSDGKVQTPGLGCLTCTEVASEIAKRLDGAMGATEAGVVTTVGGGPACTTDADCGFMDATNKCKGYCPRPVPLALIPRVKAAVQLIDADLCGNDVYARECGFMTPMCSFSTAVCAPPPNNPQGPKACTHNFSNTRTAYERAPAPAENPLTDQLEAPPVAISFHAP